MSEISNTLNGVELLADWLGSGDPVHPILAEARASWCVKCALNIEPNWWGRVKSAIADVMRAQLELKHGMNLETRHDSNLHVCKACGCCLPLKVWAPRDHIRAHTSQDVLRKMPQGECWIRRELAI